MRRRSSILAQYEYNRMLTLPRFLPENQASCDELAEILSDHSRGSLIKSVLDVHHDIHVFKWQLTLKNISDSIDYNIFDSTSILVPNASRGLLALGCGNGESLIRFINSFHPEFVCVVVSDWHDYISSFWHIDWQELHSTMQRQGRELRISCVRDETELLSNLLSNGTLQLEHCYCLVSGDSEAKVVKWFNTIDFRRVANTINYLGYSYDEYNMIYNTIRTLVNAPKLLSKPRSRVCSQVMYAVVVPH